MKERVPLLLNFYGLSNGTKNLFFGQLANAYKDDLSFAKYSRRKMFRTIFNLYRTRALMNEQFTLHFNVGEVTAKTDLTGSFWCEAPRLENQNKLVSVTIGTQKKEIAISETLYSTQIHTIESNTIVVSDLDDTLIHSFIKNKLRKLRTLLFTSVEKRKAVMDMAHLIKHFSKRGATPFYLSNSEQNLYPLLYRFLLLNEFPPGPMFLKQWRKMKHLFRKKQSDFFLVHKEGTLEKIRALFPDKKFILIGDNTQYDLPIYLKLASKYPENILFIVIRKVHERVSDIKLLEQAEEILVPHNIKLHYASSFPQELKWVIP